MSGALRKTTDAGNNSAALWSRGPIKTFVKGIYDGPHATPKESNEGPIFLGIKNVTPEGRLDLSEIRHVSEEEFGRWTKRVTPQEDDIVFSYEATLHRYAIIPKGFRGCLGRRMALVRPDKTKTSPRYLHYYFLSPAWRAKVDASIITGATVDRVPLTKVPSFEINLPPLPTQQRIAEVLSAYDDLIENNRRRIKLLEQAAKLLYREWFVHLRFPGHDTTPITNGLPQGWEKGTVSDFGNVITGKTPSTKNATYFDGNVPFIKTPDMYACPIVIKTEQTLTEEGANTQSNKYIPANSIMVSCIGSVGIVAMNAEIAQTNQQINSVVPKKDYFRHYAYFALGDLKPLLEGMGGGATMANVNKGKFENVPVILPSNDLLIAYETQVLPIFKQIMILAKQNQKLAEARDILLPRLMNGEVAV